MSTTIFLINYPRKETGEYIEESLKTLGQAEVSEELLGVIVKKFPLAEVEIFEDNESSISNPVECFNLSDMEEIQKTLQTLFVEKTTDSSLKNNSDEELQDLMFKTKMLLDLWGLVRAKNTEYQSDNNILLVLG